MTVPVIAEPVVRIGAFTVTNALVNSSLLMLAIVSFSFWFRSSLHKIPGRIQNLIELLLETMLGYFDQVTKSRAKSKRL